MTILNNSSSPVVNDQQSWNYQYLLFIVSIGPHNGSTKLIHKVPFEITNITNIIIFALTTNISQKGANIINIVILHTITQCPSFVCH